MWPPMATIRTRKRTDGTTTWNVRWRQNGKEMSQTFARERQATKFRGMVDAAGQQTPPGWVLGYGFIQPEPAETITVKAWCNRAIAARSGIDDRTRADYVNMLNRHLTDLGELDLTEISREHVGLWVTGLDLAPKSVANIHGVLSTCLTEAVADGHIPANPAKGVGLPRGQDPQADVIALTQSDVDLVVAQLDAHWHPLVRLLHGTGLRWGEATGLPVSNVDVFTPAVRVTQAFKRQPLANGGGNRIGPPKTRRARRTVSITDELRDELLPLIAGRLGHEFVFTTSRGIPVTHAHFFLLVWRPAVFAAQSCDTHRGKKWLKGQDHPVSCGCAGVLMATPRIHDLRHAHASALIGAGVPLPLIQRRLGHESITTTIDRYGHLLPDSDTRVLAALSSTRAGATST